MSEEGCVEGGKKTEEHSHSGPVEKGKLSIKIEICKEHWEHVVAGGMVNSINGERSSKIRTKNCAWVYQHRSYW